ncbi:MAG: Haloalkane dehalogenase 2 [uncultured Sulfurovum sp.]|uniref:Haloalkane dehalogenase 2 n=1 Tax=uncultured Sulfurovum sp. TaxID=269237 RepID=A0A6S6SA56_9BACT|nr:MAG: Haloalkane dehalogenase 2 [uncultured Sulfurovum sp.]
MRKLLLLISLLFVLIGCTDKTRLVSTNEPKFEVNKKLYPFKSNYLTLESGAKIHYVDEGEGEVLLLLHGNPTWSFLYRDMIAELKNDFRVIAPDYAGFGLSIASKDFGFKADEHAKLMNEFVEKMDLNNTTIMVQDWGGPIGFDIAINQPERIKAFVIGNTWAWELERVGHKAFSTLFGGYVGQFISWLNNGVVGFFMSQGVEHELSDEVLAMYDAPFKSRSHRKQTHVFPAQLWDADEFLKSVYEGLETIADKPALIVWGTEDFAFQEPERERFEETFKNHKTVLLEEAGHFIQEDAPKEISTAIKVWYPTIE